MPDEISNWAKNGAKNFWGSLGFREDKFLRTNLFDSRNGISITRFGEISPIWHNFKTLWLFWKCPFRMCQNFDLIWANFYCQNLKNILATWSHWMRWRLFIGPSVPLIFAIPNNISRWTVNSVWPDGWWKFRPKTYLVASFTIVKICPLAKIAKA